MSARILCIQAVTAHGSYAGAMLSGKVARGSIQLFIKGEIEGILSGNSGRGLS
jgi:hypothetical protein